MTVHKDKPHALEVVQGAVLLLQCYHIYGVVRQACSYLYISFARSVTAWCGKVEAPE